MIISPHMEEELCRAVLVYKLVTLGNSSSLSNNQAYYQVDTLRDSWLTNWNVRHNNTYIWRRRRFDGQTQEARSEAAGTQTHRHPQPSSRLGLRRLVPRGPLLRFQGPATSALRDVAAPPRGGRFCGWCGLHVRSLSPNLLSGTNRFREQGTDRPGTETAWPQGRTQAVLHHPRARPDPEGFYPRTHYHRLRQGCTGNIWHQSS